MHVKNPFQELASKWPSSLVARERVADFSGGILRPGTMANLDRMGDGPKGRIRVGRKVAYPVQDLIEWMTARSRPLA